MCGLVLQGLRQQDLKVVLGAFKSVSHVNLLMEHTDSPHLRRCLDTIPKPPLQARLWICEPATLIPKNRKAARPLSMASQPKWLKTHPLKDLEQMCGLVLQGLRQQDLKVVLGAFKSVSHVNLLMEHTDSPHLRRCLDTIPKPPLQARLWICEPATLIPKNRKAARPLSMASQPKWLKTRPLRDLEQMCGLVLQGLRQQDLKVVLGAFKSVSHVNLLMEHTDSPHLRRCLDTIPKPPLQARLWICEPATLIPKNRKAARPLSMASQPKWLKTRPLRDLEQMCGLVLQGLRQQDLKVVLGAFKSVSHVNLLMEHTDSPHLRRCLDTIPKPPLQARLWICEPATLIPKNRKAARPLSMASQLQMVEDTSFEGLGTDVRFGSSGAPSARFESGFGRFQERVSCESTDGTHRLATSQTVLGHHTKASLAGKTVDLRAGYIDSKEQESSQTSFHGKSAQMVEDTSFEGLGTDVRFGSSGAPSARFESGFGRFQERVSCESTDGTHRLATSQTVLGHHTKASLAGKTMDLRAGYIDSKEQESSQTSFHGKSAQMVEDTSFEGLGTDVRFGSSGAPSARFESGFGRFQERVSCEPTDGTQRFFSETDMIGASVKTTVDGATMFGVQAGVGKQEEIHTQISTLQNGQMQVESNASSNGGLFLKGNVLGVAGLSATLGSKTEANRVTTHVAARKLKEDFSETCLHGLACTTSLGSCTYDWSTGRSWKTEGHSTHQLQGNGVAFARETTSDQCVSFEDKFIGFSVSDETQQYETRAVVETYGLEQPTGSVAKLVERQMKHERNLQTGQETTVQTVAWQSALFTHR